MSEGTEKEEALYLFKGLLIGFAISVPLWAGIIGITYWFITR